MKQILNNETIKTKGIIMQNCDIKGMTVSILRSTLKELQKFIQTSEQQETYENLFMQINSYDYNGGINVYSEKFIREAILDFKQNLQKKQH